MHYVIKSSLRCENRATTKELKNKNKSDHIFVSRSIFRINLHAERKMYGQLSMRPLEKNNKTNYPKGLSCKY